MDETQGASPMNTSGGGQGTKNPQFPLLSELPVCPDARMPDTSPIDTMVLEKTSPRLDPEVPIEKDIKPLITDTNERLAFALSQSKHQKAVQAELKALLEHEKKILVQLADRANKFSMMKDENKKKIDEWEDQHKQRMPFYSQYLKELMEIPEDHCLTQEGVPTQVGQKILYNIVEKTSHIANNAIVQMSMQNTLINDVDLTLGKIRQYCAVMIRQIDNWLKLLTTQSEHQERIIELWETIKQRIKDLKELKDEGDGGSLLSAAEIKELEARVSKLENTVDTIQGVDPSKPTKTPTKSPGGAKTPESKPRPPECPPCPEKFPTGKDYFGDMYSPSPPPPQQMSPPAPPATYVDGRLQRCRAPSGKYSIDLLDYAGFGFPIPKAAMEKGGRQRGQPIPLTPPTPPPPRFGAFMPVAASSPHGSMREDYNYARQDPTDMGQYRDPAILPKIQEDLQRLSNKNKKLEELVNNFRQMRQLLTDEMDKAVKLNQKLQRDLYYVAQEASKKTP